MNLSLYTLRILDLFAMAKYTYLITFTEQYILVVNNEIKFHLLNCIQA